MMALAGVRVTAITGYRRNPVVRFFLSEVAMKIDILGTKYTIRRVNAGQDETIDKMRYGGYCSNTDKEIVILNLKSTPEWRDEEETAIRKTENTTIRHEIIHAFLNESGLQWNSFATERAWAKNEEMVDWFAIQSPKIFAIYQKLGII